MTSSLTIGLISAGCIFGGVLLGLVLRGLLPDYHLRDDSKDTVKVGAGMIATVSALVLGLLVASAKNTFDMTEAEITQRSAKIILLDRVLADYGPETKATREQLHNTVAATIEMLWPAEKKEVSGLTGYEQANGVRADDAAQSHANDRRPAPVIRYGAADHQRSAPVPLALDRTDAARDSDTVPGGVAFLAHDASHQLRPSCTSQCHRHHRTAHQRVVGLGGDLHYPGHDSPPARHDQSFERADAQRARTSGTVSSRPRQAREAVDDSASPAKWRLVTKCRDRYGLYLYI